MCRWKRPNSEHPLSNFQSDLTICPKKIARSKGELRDGGPGSSSHRSRKPLKSFCRIAKPDSKPAQIRTLKLNAYRRDCQTLRVRAGQR